VRRSRTQSKDLHLFSQYFCNESNFYVFYPNRNSKAKPETDLKELAQDTVRRAMAGGATAAECVIREGDEFSTVVRLGQVETLKEAGSRAIGVRVFQGQRAASTYSSDFSREGLDRMLKSALELSKITSEDPFAGLSGAVATGLAAGRS